MVLAGTMWRGIGSAERTFRVAYFAKMTSKIHGRSDTVLLGLYSEQR